MQRSQPWRGRLGWLGFACVLAACYEGMPRRGPLAALADSLVPPGADLECTAVEPMPWSNAPRLRTCFNPADSSDSRAVRLALRPQTDYIMLGSTGKVYSVTQTWPGDSLGQARAAVERQLLNGTLGPAHYNGTDGHGNGSTRWRGNGVCASLHEERRPPRFFELDRSIPGLYPDCQ